MPRNFAVIPAAGASSRMTAGHKLLLPWHDGRTVLDQCLSAWQHSRIERFVVVLRSEDRQLFPICEHYSKATICEVDHSPPDMRASIELGLRCLGDLNQNAQVTLSDRDRWLVAPADLPTLRPEIINAICEEAGKSLRPIVPFYGKHRGHPVSLRWPDIEKLRDLPSDRGLNSLLCEGNYDRLELPESWRPRDIDTYTEYQTRLEESRRRERRTD